MDSATIERVSDPGNAPRYRVTLDPGTARERARTIVRTADYPRDGSWSVLADGRRAAQGFVQFDAALDFVLAGGA